ncbi:hypothetical protein PSSHI_24760 [Photobacterium sp. R1]
MLKNFDVVNWRAINEAHFVGPVSDGWFNRLQRKEPIRLGTGIQAGKADGG